MEDIQFRFITYTVNGVPHVRMTDPPHIKAQVIQFHDQKKAEDYHQQYKPRATGRVQGCNIFLKHAGFHEKPGRFITEEEVQLVINKMCQWYNSSKSRYQTKSITQNLKQ